LRGGDGGARVGELCLGARAVGLAVALGAVLLDAVQRAVVRLDARARGGDLGWRCRSLLLQLLERGERGGIFMTLQLGATQVVGVGVALILRATVFDVAGRKLGGAQRGVGGGQPRQRVRIVHLQQQLASLDLVAHIDVDLLHLARNLRMGLEVVQRLDLAGGPGGLYQVLIDGLGRAYADPLARERVNRINRRKDDDEGCPPDCKRALRDLIWD
jgi:hypothetical protein